MFLAERGLLSDLKVAKLGELLTTLIQQASKWLGMQVGGLVGTNVASLCEPLVADVTREWLLACVASLMGLCSV